MKRSLMDFLICPSCKSERLALEVYAEVNNEIEEGLVTCGGCQSTFPVIKGIPRMLDGELLKKLVTGYDEFMARHGKSGASGGTGLAVHDTDERIARGFEFEWQKHAQVLDEHELEFLHVLGDVITEDDIRDAVVLDAGCGQGRFSYFYQKHGAKTVVSFDLGEQTLISRKNLLSKGMDAYVVQASIYDPPFKQVFDLVSSIGVIHHLPDPEKGFRTLYQRLLKPGGKIFIWVYGQSSIIPIIKALRTFTLNRGVKFNRFLGFFFAVPLYGINQFYNLLNAVGLKGIAEHIPWHMYYDRGFSNVWTICFDKLNSGIAFYYTREDLQGWLDRLEDSQTGALSERYPGKSGSSWRLMAQKQQ